MHIFVQYRDTEFTLWDRYVNFAYHALSLRVTDEKCPCSFFIEGDLTLQELIKHFEEKYRLEISMLSSGVSMLYSGCVGSLGFRWVGQQRLIMFVPPQFHAEEEARRASQNAVRTISSLRSFPRDRRSDCWNSSQAFYPRRDRVQVSTPPSALRSEQSPRLQHVHPAITDMSVPQETDPESRPRHRVRDHGQRHGHGRGCRGESEHSRFSLSQTLVLTVASAFVGSVSEGSRSIDRSACSEPVIIRHRRIPIHVQSSSISDVVQMHAGAYALGKGSRNRLLMRAMRKRRGDINSSFDFLLSSPSNLHMPISLKALPGASGDLREHEATVRQRCSSSRTAGPESRFPLSLSLCGIRQNVRIWSTASPRTDCTLT